MNKIKWVRLAGLLTAAGSAIVSVVAGDFVTAIGMLGAALSSSGIKANASAQ